MKFSRSTVYYTLLLYGSHLYMSLDESGKPKYCANLYERNRLIRLGNNQWFPCQNIQNMEGYYQWTSGTCSIGYDVTQFAPFLCYGFGVIPMRSKFCNDLLFYSSCHPFIGLFDLHLALLPSLSDEYSIIIKYCRWYSGRYCAFQGPLSTRLIHQYGNNISPTGENFIHWWAF